MHCFSILNRMLQDVDSHDVSFEFEVPCQSYVQEPISDKTPEHDPANTSSNSSYDAFPELARELKIEDIDDGVPEESDEEEEDSEKTSKVSSSMTEVDKDQGLLKPKSKDDIDSIKKDKGKGGSSINSSATTIEVVTAHKIVLSQFEYFRTMFSSSFAEGGPGAKTIRIKDTDPQCFRILIEHLYLGQLTSNMEPRITTEDFVQENVPTWEDVYLVADRYNVTELRDRAAERILRNLSTAWVVPFLFRTAYLFEDLRLPVIKYIVQFCMSSVAAKDALAKYYEHEECSSIMADILKELWTAKTNTASK
ncbi:hypothetical protein BCR41DRAFT_140529 [Lobosporangium transversale]|uniref:BTB domain-containing protein n=1 Tax=Lobosporangium transversale TaxID=64571 RepID=A0A1Y2GF21_9FUNG|nr:hypothetical protein BCR41DRAFT_140529 [Lobosporangium transversale]ORZ09069.1 hypothetical protein BCR41DRAFT_140529 [Lobosporangium transversale]|eukprot:XP_021878696.1 hypothetical protein BCR41DRAFT_140529 [Lobosporangium transversale]